MSGHGDVVIQDVENVRQRVDDVLAQTMTRHRETLAAVDDVSVALLDAVTDLLQGGKRLRPLFGYWGWRGAGGGEAAESPILAAAALEMFQAAALIHDDVIDDSDTRRGNPTVHRRFAHLHAEGNDGSAWSGEPDRFGQAAAILAGDLCLAWSSELLMEALTDDANPRHWRDARSVYDVMCTQLMAGQYLDIQEQAEALGTVERALHVIRFKSAKYTIEHPLLIGGSMAGAEPAVLKAYSSYGVPLGEAFQLRDDLLGVFGDPETTGKPSGDDLREGKRTVLVALAARQCSPAQREVLQTALGNPELDAAGVDAVREVLEDTGAHAEVERMIATRVEAAHRALEGQVIAPEGVAMLTTLIEATTKRAT